MQKEVRFGGLATNPSDYDAADGQLTASMGLVNEDGAMRPVWQPKGLATFPVGYVPIYIHKTANYKHYIIQDRTSNHVRLLWIDANNIDNAVTHPVNIVASQMTELYNSPNSELYSIKTVGNTIVLMLNTGMMYILWKNNLYKTLGASLPELDVSFGLQGEKRSSSDFYLRYSNYSQEAVSPQGGRFDGSADHFPYDIGDVKKMRGVDYYNQSTGYHFTENPDVDDCVYGQINSLVAQIHREGKFVYPFMVRCAYRLYDESLAMHTSPVLMLTDNVATPRVIVKSYDRTEHGNQDINCQLSTIQYQLVFILRNFQQQIQDWLDIISSVDIFVSTPFYTYDTTNKIDTWSCMVSRAGLCIAKLYEDTGNPLYIRQSTDTVLGGATQVDLHQRDIHNDIKECNIFRLLYSVRTEELIDVSTQIVINPSFDLSTLGTREAMTGDINARDVIVPSNSFVYNSRLMLVNVSKQYATPLRPNVYVCEINGPDLPWYKFFVFLRKEDKDMVIEGATGNIGADSANLFSPFIYVYYPDPDAYKIVIMSSTTYCELPLTKHDFLNGAYYLYSGWEPHPSLITSPPIPTTDNTAIFNNKIYISDVGNPFTFPAVKTVGCDSIIGIAAVTKPLSQGQYGQQALYAFTKEGVWTLDIDAEGNILPAHPTTYDVCTNVDSITQMEQAVLFVSDRGIMLLQGSETVCLTDGIIGDNGFDIAQLPYLSRFRGTNSAAMTHEFLAGCRMVYDYQHQHIIVYNPATTQVGGNDVAKYPYAFVLSMKSKLWGMMESNLASTLNSYPEALAIDKQGKLVSFAGTTQQHVQGLMVTRPLKLGTPDIYKTIHTMKQNGMFAKGHVQTLLYGTRDGGNYHLVGSSVNEWLRGLRGSPYRWFCIALLTDLAKGESVSSATVDFEARDTGKMH